MATLENILLMWEADSEIDSNHLDSASIDTAKLHAKYLKILIEAKLKKTKLDIEYNNLRKIKFRYYRGEMTRQELSDRGWEPWQYNKPLKTEMDEFLKGDEDLNVILARIELIDTMVYALESILNQIKARGWDIKNAIAWKQFLAGS
jgi:predicted DNA-binding transcriptional regulator YafY